jgi:fucose permease
LLWERFRRDDGQVTTPLSQQSAAIRAIPARNAVAAVFGLNGLAISTWFARIPAAKQSLDLAAGRFGLVLLAMSVGSILAMLTAGASTKRFGTGRSVGLATLLLALGLVVAGIGAGVLESVPALVVGLMAIGYSSGTCEVAMNVEAAMVERRLARTLMPRFHAAWSIGTVTGAAIGAVASRLGLPIEVHLALVALVVLGGTRISVRFFLPAEPAADPTAGIAAEPGRPERGRDGVMSAWAEPRTLLLGLFVLVMAFTEGTANDWLAVAFVEDHGVSESAGAIVFGVFVAAMTTGRTAGTIALDRWGRVPVLTTTILLAAAGVGVTVLSGSLPLAVAGVALWGLGASLGFPVGMSAAADDEDKAPARVGVVALIGYTAFLAGPPVVGLLGDRVGVLRALLVVPVLLILALILVPVIRPPSPKPLP